MTIPFLSHFKYNNYALRCEHFKYIKIFYKRRNMYKFATSKITRQLSSTLNDCTHKNKI